MPNALEEYLTSSTLGMSVVPSWTPAPLPDLGENFRADAESLGLIVAPLVGGFGIGVQSLQGRMPPIEFMTETWNTIWHALPTEARSGISQLIMGIVDGLESGAAVSNTLNNIVGGVMSGIGDTISYVQTITEFAEWLVSWIEGTREDNDQARYEARLACVELLEEAGPSTWAGSNYFIPKYTRKIKLKDDKVNLAWPPDKPTGFQAGGTHIAWSGGNDCKDGGSDLSPREPGCKGAVSLYPLFMPLWGNRALGAPGAGWSMRAGMERATNGGALIWEKMSAMQGNLLADPMINLLCSAEEVYWRMQAFFTWFFPKLHAAEDAGLVVDPEFNPNNAGVGFYKTPGHLFASYTNNGYGSTDHPDLDAALGATTWSSFGGNGVSMANYNTVVSATLQFLSRREATLRRPAFCQRAIDEGIVDLMPEPKARAAVHASAAGEPPPPVGWKTIAGGVQQTPSGTQQLPLLVAVPLKKKKKKSGAGLVIAGAGLAAALALRK
jgi:hypothetical protein